MSVSPIKKIVSSWKSIQLKSNSNRHMFVVDNSSNKFQIRKAVEDNFSTKVESVNISIRKPSIKSKRSRKKTYTKKLKFAFVTLKKGFQLGNGELSDSINSLPQEDSQQHLQGAKSNSSEETLSNSDNQQE